MKKSIHFIPSSLVCSVAIDLTVEDGVIHAQLTSDLEQSQQLWDFLVVIENETAELEMDYGT